MPFSFYQLKTETMATLYLSLSTSFFQVNSITSCRNRNTLLLALYFPVLQNLCMVYCYKKMIHRRGKKHLTNLTGLIISLLICNRLITKGQNGTLETMSAGSLLLPVCFACGFPSLHLGNSLFCAKQLALDGSLFVGNKQHIQVILYSSRGHLGTTGKSQCAIWVSVKPLQLLRAIHYQSVILLTEALLRLIVVLFCHLFCYFMF